MERKSTLLVLCIFMMLLRPSAGEPGTGVDAVRERISTWSEAWRNRDIRMYGAHYHPAFRSGDLDYRGWIEKKKEIFSRSGPFAVDILGLSVFLHGDQALARFVQHFRGESLSDIGEKTLVLEMDRGKWKIISEEWQPLPEGLGIGAALPEVAELPRGPVKRNTPSMAQALFPADRLLPLPDGEASDGVGYVKDPGGHERVYIRLKEYFIPELFSLDGQKPRIVIDIRNVPAWSGKPEIPVNGRSIRQIRSYLHRKEKKLRIVLDLVASGHYDVSQTYFRKENIYCVDIKATEGSVAQ